MECGRLRHTIRIESLTESIDSYSGRVDTWTTFATTKAGIKFLRGNDLVAAQQNHPLARAMFTMRWSTKLKLMTEENLFDMFNRVHNPGYYYAKKKTKQKNEGTTMKSFKQFVSEKNKPNDPKKWAAAKAAARSKFDVYPSAYANAWASKKYKSMGGTWSKS